MRLDDRLRSCLARGGKYATLLPGLCGLAMAVLSLHVASGKGFDCVSFDCYICEVTAPTFVGQVGGS